VSSARSPICGVVAVGIRASSTWRTTSPYSVASTLPVHVPASRSITGANASVNPPWTVI
jgi:hypothetical protein